MLGNPAFKRAPDAMGYGPDITTKFLQVDLMGSRRFYWDSTSTVARFLRIKMLREATPFWISMDCPYLTRLRDPSRPCFP